VDADPAVGDDHALSGLVGRPREVAALGSMLGQAVAGRGSAEVLRGEAGVGKTILLSAARSFAPELGLDVLTCSGVRAEAHLPFAGLHQLLRPVLTFLPRIPDTQADLLRAALGLEDRLPADLYQVALATLELLSSAAAKTPLLVVADDGHWLDRPTADVLAFVSRRIAAEPIAVIIAVRDGADDHFGPWRLPDLPVPSLDPASARALLSRVAPDLAVSVRTRLLREAAGNPLALVELSTAKEAAEPPAGPIAIGDLLRQSFTARVADLPSDARLLLSAAASDTTCSLAQLSRAASVITGRPVTEAEIQPAIDARLVRLDGDRVAFTGRQNWQPASAAVNLLSTWPAASTRAGSGRWAAPAG
jgi:AAA ATPase domain